MQKIAVLLTVHDRKEKTLACLDNVFKQVLPDGFAIDVWLVDDGCTDGTPEAIREQFPQVHVIQGDGNLYWNRGMRLAWQTAAEHKDYDYYLWLNDDTFIHGNCVETLLEESRKRDDKAVIVGSTSAVGNSNITTYGGWTSKEKLLEAADKAQECETFNGNIALFPRYVYQTVGINTSIFHHAGGDTEYGLRAARKGVKCIVAAGVLGECDLHEKPSVWCNPAQPLVKRWKNLYTPLGMNPKELFLFEKEYYGLPTAAFHYITTHLHCLWPWIWNRLKL